MNLAPVHVENDRFIPACAGNAPESSASKRPSAGSSPRARGTHVGTGCRGVSLAVHPRVRGERTGDQGRDRSKTRFIPACAGNAGHASASWLRLASVHPRVRGERTIRACRQRSSPRARGTLRYSPASAGSSPRARGTRVDRRMLTGFDRFIPACAGNAVASSLVDCTYSRFIPACAGNATSSSTRLSVDAGSSPRARGTLASVERVRRRMSTGSSPRARGTPSAQCQQPQRDRFIPACAGNACRDHRHVDAEPRPVHPRVRGERVPTATLMLIAHTVHPRVRGERTADSAIDVSSAGSSPRARGTLLSQAFVSKSYSRCQLPHRRSSEMRGRIF